MNHLSIEGLSKRYGEKLLFERLDLSINEGEKVALIAKNGSGKSTIFKILQGIEDFNEGSFRFAPNLKYRFLNQNPEFNPKHTILQAVLNADNEIVNAIIKYEQSLASNNQNDLEKAFSMMDAHQAWDYEVKIKQTLDELGFEDINRPVSFLSGGERKRLALARIWIENPDMLLLDEPTNHLDLSLIEWLENQLIASKQTLLMITHDRYFLENICNRIVEIDDGKIFNYPGNYSKYLESKSIRKEIEIATVGKARSTLKTELEWIRRMPKARGTKNKARIQSFHEVKKIASQNIDDDDFTLQIEPQRIGNKLIELHHVHLSFGERVLFKDFNYKFKKLEKIGIIGPNGSGKSTLLKMITGELKPSSGKVVIGETIKFGHYAQDNNVLDDSKRIIELIRDIADFIPMKGGKKFTAAQLLETFLFDRNQQFNYVHTLSGGEKRRLYLLTILMSNPNFLILDEPTNDLDIFTLNVLEDFLSDLQINLIIVSHDRFFMDKLVDHLFIINNDGTVDDFPGNYSDFSLGKGTFFDNRKEKERAKDVPTEGDKTKSTDNKINYEAKKELKRLESQIEKLEEKKKLLKENLEKLGEDFEALLNTQKQIDLVSADLEAKTERWLELSED